MLVLGAGACRLAYDLHHRHLNTETTVVDIDPLLLATARQVIRGGSVRMRETNVEIHEMESAVKEWTLKAPYGSIGDDQFHFFVADGLEPPFAPQTFDTILTPWFIDVVPSDLRNLISALHRLLKPGGRWLNLGPLHYRPEVPPSGRYTREEAFDLAARAGFRVDSWKTQTVPYLVSKLNGRGKVEWVLAFAATKLEAPLFDESAQTPPAWLLFCHLPIPVFPGQASFLSEDPAEQLVVSAINGRNTIDDIAAILASNAGETGLTMDQLRDVVRRCLLDIHPGAFYSTQ
jgi:SAM-dependent methyltransferase